MKLPRLRYVSVEQLILGKASERSVLHLGCAGDQLERGPKGCLHVELARVATVLHGVELSVAALERVREWLPQDDGGRVRYFCGDVEELGFLRGVHYEIVLAGSVIEHLSNPGRMLEHARRLCARNGRVIISTPHVFGALQQLRVALWKTEAVNPEHTCWFSIATLTELCGRYGLVPVEWYTGYGWRDDSVKWKIKHRIGVPVFQVLPHLGGGLVGIFERSNNS